MKTTKSKLLWFLVIIIFGMIFLAVKQEIDDKKHLEAERQVEMNKKAITVTTENNAYEAGDIVKYELYNGLSIPIMLDDEKDNCYLVERLNQDKVWERFKLDKPPLDIETADQPTLKPDMAPGEKSNYETRLYPIVDINDRSEEEYTPGTYRLVVQYNIQKIKESQEVYSNEFEIVAQEVEK